MNSIHPLLITVLPLLTLVVCSVKSEYLDPKYVSCNLFECGHLNISYPFYVPPTQPSYCGLNGFNVSCNNRSQAIIRISGDNYVINEILYDKLAINITNSAFSSSVFDCPSSIHSLTLSYDGRFKFTSQHRDIFLFQNMNCSRNVTGSSKNYTKIKCDDDNRHNPLLLAVYGEDFYPKEFGECGEKVIVPYYEDEIENSSSSNSSIEEILKRGIVLDYRANNCSHCIESNGRCGFNATTSEFICLCPNTPPHRSACHSKKTRNNTWKVILPSVLSGALLIILVLHILYLLQRKKRSGQSTFLSIMMSFKRARSGLDGASMRGVAVFSYKELEEATRTFDPKRVLGEGGFGIVYYGKLKDGREVAVKRLFEKNYKRIEQFKNEIRILTDLRHENLVALYGCTTRHSRELLLVYEYIPNGTVADHLHGNQTKPVLLPWSTHKSDVYSFGVVLVELLSSLPAVDVGRHRHEINLSNYAMSRIQRSAFSELVDLDLGFETDFKVRRMTTLVAELAFRCLQHDRELRPSMEEVLEALNRIRTTDYDGLEAEEVDMMSSGTTEIMKPPPSPTDNDDVRPLRNAGQQPPSPVSVMEEWLNSSKSTTPATSRSS
ncbi:hypothetical protein V2J09_004074 [Rumex salicifolius]